MPAKSAATMSPDQKKVARTVQIITESSGIAGA